MSKFVVVWETVGVWQKEYEAESEEEAAEMWEEDGFVWEDADDIDESRQLRKVFKR